MSEPHNDSLGFIVEQQGGWWRKKRWVATNERLAIRVEAADMSQLEAVLPSVIATWITNHPDQAAKWHIDIQTQFVLTIKPKRTMTFLDFFQTFGSGEVRQAFSDPNELLKHIDAVLAGGSQLQWVAMAQMLKKVDDPVICCSSSR